VKRIGRTFQLVKPFNEISVLENVMVGAFARTGNSGEAREEAEKVIDFIGLSRHRDSLASSLTIADRKRLELARALATKPELLLLDEVMAGLNPKETEEIIDIVKSISDQGITLFMIEHVMKVIMTLSHRIIVLHHGEKIVEGTPAEVSKDKRVIDAYLGEEYLA
jgi:branched-chain amino acid transport system ATP-binding protein